MQMKDGTQIAIEFPESSRFRNISPAEARTLHDLLETIKNEKSDSPCRLAMLRSTAAHLSQFLGQSVENIKTCELTGALCGFKAYLKARHFKRNSIRSYTYHCQLLIRKAKELGWDQDLSEIESIWQPILRVMRKHRCSSVGQYAMRRGLRPDEFSDDELNSMVQSMLAEGRSYEAVNLLRRKVLRCVFEQGLAISFPRLSPYRPRIRYGIPVSQFPAPLRVEVFSLLEWKTKPCEDERPRGGRLRAETADGLQQFICRLYGFVRNIKNRKAETLAELFSKENLGEYLDWCISDRNVKLISLGTRLAMINAIVRTYPPLAGKNLQWIAMRLSQIQEQQMEEGESSIERKAYKSIEYEILADIPRRIRKEIQGLRGRDTRRRAILCRDQLLILWFRILPWRQRNVREVTFAGQAQTTRLFKDEIPPYTNLPSTKWVKDILKENPRTKFWQIIAYPAGNKTRRRIHMILPRQLVSALDEYLAVARPVLIQNCDPGTLFVNDHGKPYSSSGMYARVAGITLRYAGKRVNPHLIRDIVAFDWLKKHPCDFLTIQKLLWHTKLDTTIRVYGHDFNEAYAVCRVEEYLDAQEKDV